MLLSEVLGDREYIRERIDPTRGRPDYLSLSDLLIALRGFIPADCARVLDYGAGGSPYRTLFPQSCTYHRADLAGTSERLDFQYGSDAKLPADIGAYDLVLSTQVLEHVEDPALYLSECHRVLKPGGQLIISTHGFFREHGCPYDYWRWTSFGLRKAVAASGFEVTAAKKLTTGTRAIINLAESRLARFLPLSVIHRIADCAFASNRVVDDTSIDDTYVGLILCARRL